MLQNNYVILVSHLNSLFEKEKETQKAFDAGSLDLKWRLSILYESVERDDEQKFIDISGLSGHLLTTEQKEKLQKIESTNNGDFKQFSNSSISKTNKKSFSKKWAKKLYRKAVKRCHPDTLRTNDIEYQEEITLIYKSIVNSYDNENYDVLMVESFKLMLKPDVIQDDQINILTNSILKKEKKIAELIKSDAYAWYNMPEPTKENYLMNYMRQMGVRFVSKEKVKEVLKRKISSRKTGQKPKNNLKLRVKNKKK